MYNSFWSLLLHFKFLLFYDSFLYTRVLTLVVKDIRTRPTLVLEKLSQSCFMKYFLLDRNIGRNDMTLDEYPTLLTENLFSYPSLGTFTNSFESFSNILHSNLASLGTFLTLTLIVAFISVLTWYHVHLVTPSLSFLCADPVTSYYFISQIKHTKLPDYPRQSLLTSIGRLLLTYWRFM